MKIKLFVTLYSLIVLCVMSFIPSNILSILTVLIRVAAVGKSSDQRDNDAHSKKTKLAVSL